MTQPIDERPSPSLRRPPAAPDRWATVTPLSVRRHAEQVSSSAPPLTDGSLALDSTTRQQLSGPPRTPDLRVVTAGSDARSREVQVWAARFAQAVVEVLGGDRPLSQLLRWTSHRVYTELGCRLRILSRTSDAGRRMRTVRPQVRSVHVFHPTPDCAEVSVHVRHGQRSRAIAARLEHTGGRWQCTVLQLG